MKLSVIVIAESQPAATSVSGDVEYLTASNWGVDLDHARGENIAVLNDRYQPLPGWLHAAKTTTAEMSWGTVEPALNAWPYFLLEYAHLLGNRDPRRAPAGNAVYDRRVLERYPMSGFAREIDYHSHLVSQGVSSAFNPALSVTLMRPPDWATYRKQRFQDSRRWAQEHRLGPLALPLRLALPALLLARIARSVFADGRYVQPFLQSLPRLLEGCIIQMLGEMSGILSRNRN